MHKQLGKKPKHLSYRHVELNPNRHGSDRYYFRKGRETRIRLPDINAPEFEAAWQACLAGKPVPVAQGSLGAVRRASRGSLGWLVSLYLQSSAFNDLQASTRKPRRRILQNLIDKKGNVDITDIDRAAITDSLNERRETVHAANAWLSMVRQMFDWACKEVLPGADGPILEENPCEMVKRLKVPRAADLDEEDGFPTWSDEELAKFEAAYPHGSCERLIYEVLLCTGLRVGDATRLGRQHIRGDVIQIKTEKTNTPVTLRVTPRLQHALAAGWKGADGELSLLTGFRGKRLTKGSVGDILSEACRKIGLERSAHGLRKAAARRYAEAGTSTNQLMAIFGWSTVTMAEKYTRKADREKLALAAMDGLSSPTLKVGGGKSA